MLFGMESDFSQSPLSMLNTTFFATMFGLTYLCLDPLIKACYVLRCFYGTSLRSGEDLKAELRRIGSVTRTVLRFQRAERDQRARGEVGYAQIP
jgi:hypothetical protein